MDPVGQEQSMSMALDAEGRLKRARQSLGRWAHPRADPRGQQDFWVKPPPALRRPGLREEALSPQMVRATPVAPRRTSPGGSSQVQALGMLSLRTGGLLSLSHASPPPWGAGLGCQQAHGAPGP